MISHKAAVISVAAPAPRIAIERCRARPYGAETATEFNWRTKMIPQVVADVRDILTKHLAISPDHALKIAMALYEAGHLKDQ